MPYPARPLPSDYTRRAVCEIRDSTRSDFPINPGVLGAIIGVINRVVGGDANRRAILGYLFRNGSAPLSAKDLTGPEYNALFRWSAIRKDETTGKWIPGEHFLTEVQWVAHAAFDIAETARADPQPEATGLGIDPVIENSRGEIPDFRAYADQLELHFIRDAAK